MEAEIRARKSEVKPTFQHYGPVESLSDSEIKIIEAQIRAIKREEKPTIQNYNNLLYLIINNLKMP